MDCGRGMHGSLCWGGQSEPAAGAAEISPADPLPALQQDSTYEEDERPSSQGISDPEMEQVVCGESHSSALSQNFPTDQLEEGHFPESLDLEIRDI